MVRLAQSYKPPVLLASRRVKATIPMRGYIALSICERESDYKPRLTAGLGGNPMPALVLGGIQGNSLWEWLDHPHCVYK